MDVAGAMFTLAKEKIPQISNYDGEDLEIYVETIFKTVTLFLSASAAESPEIRKIIGIKLGLFSR